MRSVFSYAKREGWVIRSPFERARGVISKADETRRDRVLSLDEERRLLEQCGGGDKGFIRRWRATINGLETVAETHHDASLCLDEIAECRPDDVNEAAYMLANGQGKTRQSRGGAPRRTVFNA